MADINTDQIDLLHVMQKVEDVTSQKELAERVGFNVGKVNYVIKELLGKGYIKAENFVKSSNKRAYKYVLTGDGLKNKILLTEKYIAIKKLEYEELQENLNLDKRRGIAVNEYVITNIKEALK
ncbi:MAG: MarR family EPS-associated transcriptional regulator [Campylobacterota bacterium]|nr:MarR family EPS-associated transcriptional regulator [Campylobacterota bacterium]